MWKREIEQLRGTKIFSNLLNKHNKKVLEMASKTITATDYLDEKLVLLPDAEKYYIAN